MSRPPAGLALRCTACGEVVDDPLVFRCPAAVPGDDVDHVLAPPEPTVDEVRAALAQPSPPEEAANPFLRYRRQAYSWRLATASGLDDAAYVAVVERLDDAVAAIDGQGFRVTPLRALAVPGAGGVWAKVESGNVSGSHKGRHLMGLAIHLAVLGELGWLRGLPGPLAISSCGNAALAAAVVARAAGWPLQVFVPPGAGPAVVRQLAQLGAGVERCERRPGEAGDPCYLRFRERVAEGAIPFATQGNENGLTLEGGATLGLELAEQLPGAVDRVYVQVGGGALAAATWLGLARAQRAGRVNALPALHAVQTRAVAPLARALAVARERHGHGRRSLDAVLAELARGRHLAMWPWEEPGTSAATGILDDETYDWRAVVAAVLGSGGDVVDVTEDDLEAANRLASATGLDVDHTGSAGLAGLRADIERGRFPADARAAVLLTGARR